MRFYRDGVGLTEIGSFQDHEGFDGVMLGCREYPTISETVRLGLEALIRHAAYERLRALRGSEPGARDVPRRRDRTARKRRGA